MDDDRRDAMLQRLHDVEAIKHLKARYFRFLDTKQWDQWEQLFTPDACFELFEAGGTGRRFEGRDEFLGWVRDVTSTASTVHHGCMPEIEITAPDRATGIWAMTDLVVFPNDGEQPSIRGYGHYHEEYAKNADGEWQIAFWRVTRLRVDLLDAADNRSGAVS